MKTIIRLLINAIAVLVISQILSGVHIDSYVTAIIVAIVLAVLNLFVKPLLVLFTLPATILTLGLFLLIINGLIIYLAGKFVSGFSLDGFWWAVLFSLLLSILQSILQSVLKED
ncbi:MULTISPECIES: phage holin family protein [Aestuariibaculum]|uniref:Phage holin family protein n=1 Tax=Aestuariibaculum lutulentum TaxID=2920935 RepID=A0ABS9RME3_9FLAO|nr:MULTISPECIES: phage holin family protein [Aestuariibaculum]MCH4553279.1 phage holin family protein [Aestuariibaculum lutulentum]MCR8668763.1 phage holin family protein [Aestuariibaculum sp. M13]